MTEEIDARGRIILGSGRSGTTWVQDCLAEANRLRPIFEPLHEEEGELGRRFAYRMLAPGDENAELKCYFKDLSDGRVRSLWIDYRGRRRLLVPHLSRFSTIRGIRGYGRLLKKHLLDRRRLRSGVRRHDTLIKCIRANLMAGWLSQDLGFRTVLLVRHPCASVESQYSRGSAWDPEPVMERYRSDTRLHEASNGIYLPMLNSRLTRLQALTLNWVIENQGPFARASVEGYTVVFYEHLRERPSEAWPGICAAMGLRLIPSQELVETPSQQSYREDSECTPSVTGPRWQRAFSIDQLREIQSILDSTECDLYHVSSCSPLRVPVPIA